MILHRGRLIRSKKTLGRWRHFALRSWRAPSDPTITYSVEYDGTAALRYLDEIRAQSGTKITLTHLFVKGLGLALVRHPELNVRVVGRKIHPLPTVSLSMPSFVAEGEDLHFFCIDNVERKHLSEIAAEIRAQAAAADERNAALSADLPGWMLAIAAGFDRFLTRRFDTRIPWLNIPDISVAPVMFSAAGRFARFQNTTGALFPGHTAIFILGTTSKKPVVRDDSIVIRPMIPFCMSADHRIIDGYTMSRYTDFMGEFLQDPAAFIEPVHSAPSGVRTHAPIHDLG